MALLLPGLVFFGALVLVALNQTLMVWSQSQTQAQASAWQTILGAITGKAYVQAITKLVRGPVSRWALAQLIPVARWFVALNGIVAAHSRAVTLAEEGIADGFERLRHVVIPREVGKPITKINAKVKTAQKTADTAKTRAANASTAVTHLGATVKPQIKAHAHAIDVTLPGEIGRIREREKTIGREIEHPSHSLLKRWAGWLWAAGLAGIFVKALAKRFPWLFCRKVNTIGKRLCGLDDSLLQSLLADALAIAGTVSLLEFISDAQAVETVALDALSGFIREMPNV